MSSTGHIVRGALCSGCPRIGQTLFSVLPMSSLLKLTSSAVARRSCRYMEYLSVARPNILCRVLSSPSLFISGSCGIGLPIREELALCQGFNLCNVCVLVSTI